MFSIDDTSKKTNVYNPKVQKTKMNYPTVNIICDWLEKHNLKNYKVEHHHFDLFHDIPVLKPFKCILPQTAFVIKGEKTSIYLELENGSELSIQTHPGLVTINYFASTFDDEKNEPCMWKSMEELGCYILNIGNKTTNQSKTIIFDEFYDYIDLLLGEFKFAFLYNKKYVQDMVQIIINRDVNKKYSKLIENTLILNTLWGFGKTLVHVGNVIAQFEPRTKSEFDAIEKFAKEQKRKGFSLSFIFDYREDIIFSLTNVTEPDNRIYNDIICDQYLNSLGISLSDLCYLLPLDKTLS